MFYTINNNTKQKTREIQFLLHHTIKAIRNGITMQQKRLLLYMIKEVQPMDIVTFSINQSGNMSDIIRWCNQVLMAMDMTQFLKEEKEVVFLALKLSKKLNTFIIRNGTKGGL